MSWIPWNIKATFVFNDVLYWMPAAIAFPFYNYQHQYHMRNYFQQHTGLMYCCYTCNTGIKAFFRTFNFTFNCSNRWFDWLLNWLNRLSDSYSHFVQLYRLHFEHTVCFLIFFIGITDTLLIFLIRIVVDVLIASFFALLILVFSSVFGHWFYCQCSYLMNWSRRSSPVNTGIQLRLRVTDFIVSVAIDELIASFFALSILAFSSVFDHWFYCQCNCWMNWSRHSSPINIGIQFCLRVTDFAVGVVVDELIASFFALSIFVLSSFLDQ